MANIDVVYGGLDEGVKTCKCFVIGHAEDVVSFEEGVKSSSCGLGSTRNGIVVHDDEEFGNHLLRLANAQQKGLSHFIVVQKGGEASSFLKLEVKMTFSIKTFFNINNTTLCYNFL